MIKNNRKIILINFCFNKIGYFLILEQLEKLRIKYYIKDSLRNIYKIKK